MYDNIYNIYDTRNNILFTTESRTVYDSMEDIHDIVYTIPIYWTIDTTRGYSLIG
jgi:hypothetical protein